MTGDGVNDAAALAQAQVGIAVEGSTDAARNAADIVLTAPGLSAIYAAVYESRLIFRRLRSYVLYRVAATVQIVVVLCALIFGWNAELQPLYRSFGVEFFVSEFGRRNGPAFRDDDDARSSERRYIVILALFNDATMTPIASDDAGRIPIAP